MGSRCRRVGVLAVFALTGCTFANPGLVEDGDVTDVDLSAHVEGDFAEPIDLSMVVSDDLPIPEPPDLFGVAGDLTTPAITDLMTPPDLKTIPDLLACGAPGQPCCGGTTCNGAGCCNANVCVAAGSDCAAGTSICQAGTCKGCGGPTQPCCATATSKCRTNGCCIAGSCIAEGQRCSATEVCRASACSACGGAGQPCCNGNSCNNNGCCLANDTCVANGTACLGVVMCNNGSCTGGTINCGNQGQACCPNPTAGQPQLCTAPSTYCTGNTTAGFTCQHCGGNGEHCCNGNQCANGCCAVAANNTYTCFADMTACFAAVMCTASTSSCGGCGAVGQACCKSGSTTFCSGPDTHCNAGNLCETCGGTGQACCPPNNFCAAGRNCTNNVCG